MSNKWIFDDEFFDISMSGTLTEEVIIDEEGWWLVPMSTGYLDDKKMDLETLGLLTLFSNRAEGEEHRFLYERGTNSLLSNIDKMEELSKNKRRNIKRAIKKLAECDNEVVEICADKEGRIYYKINNMVKDEDGKPKYVTINSRMLEYLINTGNSNLIKTYCLIKVLLWNNKDKCYYKRPLTRDFLLRNIGLSVCEKNLQQMSDILDCLTRNGFIKREKCVRKETINGEVKIKNIYLYEILTFTEWNEFRKEGRSLKRQMTKK